MFFEAAEETGTRVDGVDTQNTRLEVQHNFKEMASRRCRMVAVLKNGRHLGFSDDQSGKFDQKQQLNISRKVHTLRGSYQILLLPATLIQL